MKKNLLPLFRCLKLFMLLFFFVSLNLTVSASPDDGADRNLGPYQQPASITVKGKVSGSQGPLEGVTVRVDGTATATTTNAAGDYTISAPENGALIFSFVGYTEQRVSVANQSVINVSLAAKPNDLQEVIVTGYRTQTRGTVTGSVSTVNSSEFSNIPVDNLSNALAGRLSGVAITQNAGTPGMESAIRIRSQGTFNNASPLFVIDGVVSDKFAFDGLTPNEVENITILKDGASAAIYGSRAANGVVLVTTKRGREGAPKLSYNGIFGFQQPTKVPERLNAFEHASAINHQLRYTNSSNPQLFYTQDELDYFRTHSWDWVKEMWRDPLTTQHSVDISGGAKTIKYFIGASYNYSTGSFETIDFSKLSVRGNMDVAVTNNLRVSLDLNTDDRKTNGPNWDVNNLRYDDLFKALMLRPALVPPYVNGLPVGNNVEWHPGVVLTPQLSGYNKRNWTGLNMLATVNYTVPFIKGLSAKTSLSQYNRNIYTKQFSLPYNMTLFNGTGTNGHIVGEQPAGPRLRDAIEFVLARQDRIKRYQFNAQLNFKRNFGKHGIDALAVYEQAEEENINFNARRDNLITSSIDQFLAGSVIAQAGGGEAQTARISYVGLASYNCAQKYLLETSFRYDGSVIFAPERRWGFFPSASAGWRISQEPFFEKVGFVDDLKLRASVALLGNDAIDPFQWLQSYSIVGGGAVFNTQTLGIEPGVLANRHLTWEKSLSYNAGLDAQLLKRKINFKFEIFKRHTYDILGTRLLSLPSTLGANLPDENYQEIDAKGFEIEVGYNNDAGKSKNRISYYARGNFGYASNEIVRVDQAQNIPGYMNALGRPVGLQANGNINRNGSATNDMLFGLVATDIIRTQKDLDALPAGYTIMGAPAAFGMLNYKDIRGPNSETPDGKITNDDREFLAKYSIPPTNFGLSFGGAWKSLSIDVLLQGLAGAKTMLPTAGRDIQARPEESSFRYWANSWTPETPDAKYPGYRVAAFRTRFDPSSFWLVDNSFLRVKNVSVSYNLSQRLMNKAGLKNGRVFFTGTNLFMIFSNNDIYDPEMHNILSYPMMKSYSFGLNIGL